MLESIMRGTDLVYRYKLAVINKVTPVGAQRSVFRQIAREAEKYRFEQQRAMKQGVKQAAKTGARMDMATVSAVKQGFRRDEAQIHVQDITFKWPKLEKITSSLRRPPLPPTGKRRVPPRKGSGYGKRPIVYPTETVAEMVDEAQRFLKGKKRSVKKHGKLGKSRKRRQPHSC